MGGQLANRRNKSNVRGGPDPYNYPQPGMMANQQMPVVQHQGLKHNSSKPQL